MMRSPISRVATTVVCVFAFVGVAIWLQSIGTTYAFADFIKPILDAKSAKFKTTTEIKGPPARTITGETMVLDATRSRTVTEMPNKAKMVMILDWGQGKSLTLEPATKKAMILTFSNLTKEQVSRQDMFAQFRSILLDARDMPDVKREPLGEKEIDGRRVVGFRVNFKGTDLSVWGDPQTGLPVRVETTMAMFPGVKSTMSDFVFNVDMDESLFSVEPPPGYTVQNEKLDLSQPEEKNLIETFRIYSELSGGPFPESFDNRAIMTTVAKMVGMKVGMKSAMRTIREDLTSGKQKPSEEQIRKAEDLMKKFMDWQLHPEKKPSEEEMRKLEDEKHKLDEEMRKTAGLKEGFEKLAGEKGKLSKEEILKKSQAAAKKAAEGSVQEFVKVQIPIQRGMSFVFALRPEADAHYAGKGVSLGAPDTPIFWYRPTGRPTGSKNYRVIYADLSVRDADEAPDVPDAQPVPFNPKPKQPIPKQ